MDLYRGKGTKKDSASVLLILVLLLAVFVVKIVFVLVIIGDVGGNFKADTKGKFKEEV